EMPMAVEGVNADPPALVAEVLEVGVIGLVARRHQTLAFGQGLRLIDELPLFRSADRNLPLPPALGPGILEYQSIATIRPLRDDLDRLRAAQAESGLQAQRDADAISADFL